MTEKILLGTYTRGASEGIYEANLNLDSKCIEDVKLLVAAGNPTYLTMNAAGTVIYSIVAEDGQGGIMSLVYEGNQWVRRTAILEDGPAPCYLSYDEKRQFIYTANYHAGKVQVYRTDETGDLNLLDTVQHQGSSIHENQKSPHAHFIQAARNGEYILACDLGTDEIYTYEVSEAGKLTEKHRISVKPGTGPRHLIFHPYLDKAYIVGELSSEILVANYTASTGEFKIVDTVPTIPATFTDWNSGAAVRISSNGKYLYVSNRGHNSIAAFKVVYDGALELIAYYPTEGETPRDFNLNETEDFIIVGHQDSDYLTLFERDGKTGELSKIPGQFSAPEVVCVQFIPVDTVQESF